MLICRWPGKASGAGSGSRSREREPKQKDSCVRLYWLERQMEPKAVRRMALTTG